MKLKLMKLPAILMAIGMALVLTGCPITADDRDLDMGGPGRLFNAQPISNNVTIVITGIPAGYNDDQITVNWRGLPPQSGTVLNGHLAVTFPSVSNPTQEGTVGLGAPINLTTANRAPPVESPTLLELSFADF